ncbi:hypothetical protein ABIB00_003391 [Bradyrhizobium sp. LB14.3]|uniref:hypothetical protein n=1 Tax=Bradyrhizobium sp. LB14.3 TaxID=3156328 RepID=UPI0033939A80
MNVPGWIPELVRPILELMSANPACTGQRRPVFDRLLEDPRMQPVFNEFLRRDRETGDFLYPAKFRNSNQSSEDAQVAAIREVLQLAISAASDRISVSKTEQIDEAGQRWSDQAAQLRIIAHDMALEAELGMLELDDPATPALSSRDVLALLRVAKWLEHLKSGLRRPDDPLMVDRHRGDPIVRGVQIMIGVKLAEQFGERLDGTAATLTSVALDVETTPRTSRSALTEPKLQKRRSAR